MSEKTITTFIVNKIEFERDILKILEKYNLKNDNIAIKSCNIKLSVDTFPQIKMTLEFLEHREK